VDKNNRQVAKSKVSKPDKICRDEASGRTKYDSEFEACLKTNLG
jgi:hypothetical protein